MLNKKLISANFILREEKGVALIITFFVMVIILAVVLSLSLLLYNQLKIIKNIGDSVIAFYAADSGVEKVLYYDRKVLPPSQEGQEKGVRGLCYMCAEENSERCKERDGEGDESLYCKNCWFSPLDEFQEGCDFNKCNNCEVYFETEMGKEKEEKNYSVYAWVSPSSDFKASLLEIESKGNFRGVVRKIKTNTRKKTAFEIIEVRDPCIQSLEEEESFKIKVSAEIFSKYPKITISKVWAQVKKEEGTVVTTITLFNRESNLWEGIGEIKEMGSYYVDLYIQDSRAEDNLTFVKSAPYCGSANIPPSEEEASGEENEENKENNED